MKTILMSALLGVAAAVPAVTPVPVEWPGTCTSWPSWINSRGSDVTGSVMFQVSNSDDSAIDGLPLQQFSLPWQGATRNLLGVDFRASRRFAKAYYRCINGQPTIGVSAQNVSVARDKSNAHLLVEAEPAATYVPELYYLEADGKRLDGVYLGAQNRTTWGFVYRDAQCGADGQPSVRDFYEVKLQDLPVDEANPPTAGSPPEFEGFLKVVSW